MKTTLKPAISVEKWLIIMQLEVSWTPVAPDAKKIGGDVFKVDEVNYLKGRWEFTTT